MNQWYYAVNGAQQGPVPLEHLTEWVRTGQLAADAMVWRDGMAQWLTVSQVPELASALGGGGDAGGYGVAAQPAYGVGQADYAGQGQYGQQQQQYGQQPASPLGYAQPPSSYGYNGYRYGGFWWRFLAVFIDGVIMWIPNTAINAGLQAAMETSGPGLAPGRAPQLDARFWGAIGTSIAVSVTVNWLYFALQESSRYQATLGKRACGLVVTDLTGQPLSFGRATGRHFAKLASYFTLYIGFIVAGFTEKKQALHDMIAGTLVWKKP